jgi:hypothetical protein
MNIIKNRTISIYLLILFFFSVFYLYQKHTVGNDSTISEWLINYEGGFTKRGLIGQISIYLSYVFDLNLRVSILILQILIIGIYYLFLNYFLINLKLNNIIIFSIFTPIFILYPVAEIEVLARKETFLYSFFLLYFFLNNKIYRNIYKITILPLAVLIWEPVIFFFIYWFIIDFFESSDKNIFKTFLKTLLYYFPATLLAMYIAFNPISDESHFQMANFLKNNFNENCYMSCELLLTKSSIYDQFHSVIILSNAERILRYLLIILFGFGPLIILLKYSKFNKLNPLLISIIVSPPMIILFLMMTDWGRTVNMFYTFSILTYLYFYKNDLLKIEESIKENFLCKLIRNKKILITFFIVFAFGWNPKTNIVGDVGSKPGYQIPRKAIKIIYYKYFKNNF